MSEDWNKDKKKGAPPTGLYWRIEESAFGQAGDENAALDMIRNLRMAIAAINAAPYEKNAHVIEFVPGEAHSESLKILEGLQAITSHNGLVLLVSDSLALAAEAKADGIAFSDPEKAEKARAAIGDDPIIAVYLENISDIPKDIDLAIIPKLLTAQNIAKLKSEHNDLPVMSAAELDNNNSTEFVKAGSDFINASNYLNTHPEGAAKAAVNLLYAIDLALTPRQPH